MSKPVRVLVVDDSALMRKLIPQILQQDSSIEVVGTAMDGAFGLKKIEELKPDVVTLDLEMPRMDGIEMLRAIAAKHRLPVIVVSAHSQQGARATFKALALGAFDFVAKPADALSVHLGEIGAELVAKIKTAAQTRAPKLPVEVWQGERRIHKAPARKMIPPTQIVAIGISTGGPNALQYLFSQLPADFSGSIIVVQHMPEGFTEMFARRLDECSSIEVKEARSGDLLLAGRALVCPGNRHIEARRSEPSGLVVLEDGPLVNGHRPSVDVLFRSAAKEFGGHVTAVLMTGMGEDGAEGMGAVKAAGGLTIAQSEESCVVNSMPRAAIERGHVHRVVPLQMLADVLYARCSVERARPKESPVLAVSGRGAKEPDVR
jgi:two-component system chemotaxis response regulator CheB